MMKNKNQIRKLINKGLLIIDNMGYFTTGTAVGNKTKELIGVIKTLFPLIQDQNPIISDILSTASLRLNSNGIINAFNFGDVRTSLKVLKSIYCRPPKIFISHKSEDKSFVDALVDLLRLYVGSEPNKIFCSSVPNYKIDLGKEIYGQIATQFADNDVFTIIIHSPRYYQSSICLNEMGAAWILDTDCCSFLTSDCDINKLNGVIDKRYISIKVNNEDAEDRMNDFLYEVMDFFELPKPEFKAFSQWEKDRDKFLRIVNNIKYNGGQRLGKWF